MLQKRKELIKKNTAVVPTEKSTKVNSDSLGTETRRMLQGLIGCYVLLFFLLIRTANFTLNSDRFCMAYNNLGI